MAHELRLEYVGDQARIFKGQILGLPVVGMPVKSRSMVNLALTAEKATKRIGENVATQVYTESDQDDHDLESDYVNTLKYSFDIYPELKSRLHRDSSIINKSFNRSTTPLKMNAIYQESNSTQLIDDASSRLVQSRILTGTPQLDQQYKTPSKLNLKEVKSSKNKTKTTEKQKRATSGFGITFFQQKSPPRKLNSDLKGQLGTFGKLRSVSTKKVLHMPTQYFSYDTLPQIRLKTTKLVAGEPQQIQKPPRYQKPKTIQMEITAFEKHQIQRNKSVPNFQLDTLYSPQKDANQMQKDFPPVVPQNEIIKKQPMVIEVNSMIENEPFRVETFDQYVIKYIRQKKYDKIRTNDNQVKGILKVLLGDYLSANRLFKDRNLCLSLLQSNLLVQSLKISKRIGFTTAVSFIQNERFQELQDQMAINNQNFNGSNYETHTRRNKSTYVAETARLFQEDPTKGLNDSYKKIESSSFSRDPSQKSTVEELPNRFDHPFTSIYRMAKSATTLFKSNSLKINRDRPASSLPQTNVEQSGDSSQTLKPVINLEQGPLDHKFTSVSDLRYNKGMSPVTTKMMKSQEKLENFTQHNAATNLLIVSEPQTSLKARQNLTSAAAQLSSVHAKEVSDLKTEDLLSNMVQQTLADIERFRSHMGGQEKMEKYIAQFAEEWRSGQIRYQNTYKRERPWSTEKTESAYDQSKGRYAKFRKTINQLVEEYLNRKEVKSDDGSDELASVRSKQSQVQFDITNTSGNFLTKSNFISTQQLLENKQNLNSRNTELNQNEISSSSKLQVQSSPKYQQRDNQATKIKLYNQDIEIPDEIKDRYFQALSSLKVGAREPNIKELMADQLSHQEIYDLQKNVRHLERYLEDDSLISANSEVLEENFWEKVKIVQKTTKLTDIFYDDPNMKHLLIDRLESIVSTQNPIDTAPPKEHESQSDPIQNLKLRRLKRLNTFLDEGRTKFANWMKRLYEEIGFTKTLNAVLEQRIEEFQHADEAPSHQTDQNQSISLPYSVLLLIKEQFARKELKTCDVDYEMLSRMLSKNTYFSHFKNNTRQLLLLISQHKLIRQGEIFFHSDQLENTILVVISGAVSIYMCNSDKKNLRTFRNTLYPGESIGDAPLRLIIPSDKVGHLYFELKAAVDSDILLIKKDDVPSILQNEICSLMAQKIIPLQRCKLFSGAELQSPYSIFVLANLVGTKKYKIGDIIKSQNQQADDVMFLVIKGICSSVYHYTLVQFHRRKREILPKMNNGKFFKGELGVIQQQLKSVDPDFVIKNLAPEIRPLAERIKPGYLPRIKKYKMGRLKTIAKQSTQSFVDIFQESTSKVDQDTNSKSIEEDDQDEINEQSNTAESSETQITNRTQKLKDQEALVGHRNTKIMEESFEYKPIVPVITENFQVPQDKVNYKQDVKILKSKLASEDFKTAKVKFIQHAEKISAGSTICSRALLDKQRCIKQLQNELNEHLKKLEAQEKKQNDEFKIAEPAIFKRNTDSNSIETQLQLQMAKNDATLPEGIKPPSTLGFQNSAKQIQKKPEQKTANDDDDNYHGIFNQIKDLMGEDLVKSKSAEELFNFINQSQLTIVADSSDVEVLCIRRHDLSQLSEPVRRRIEREILAQLFVDIDRPFTNKKQMDSFVTNHNEWQKYKLKTADNIIFNK